jgi:hypothetical protein
LRDAAGIEAVIANRRAEALIVAALFAVSAWWGSRQVIAFVERGGTPSFYQQYFEPAVMLACDRGFTVAEGRRPAMVDDFLAQRTDSVDCDRLPPDLAVGTRNVYQYGWFYLMATVAVAWKIVGVSWSGLAPLFGVLFGLVVVLTYGLFRTAVPWWVALVAAGMIAISPLHLQNLPHLRDYAKAPFVLSLILILLVLVRRPHAPRTLLLLAATYGAILGFGYGFRTDLLANIPPFIVTILLFMPGGIVSGLGLKAAAIAVAAAVFLLTSWPAASYVAQSGGCQWHAVLLGMADGFTTNMRLVPSFYDWVPFYSDEYVHTAVNSYAYRVSGAEFIPYCSAEYDAATGAWLRDIAWRFPGDMLTRAYASTWQILDLPFFLWRDGYDSGRGSNLGAMLHLVAGTARLASLVAVVIIGAVSTRLGVFALCVMLYFGGYPSLQFSDRHFFHLEFLGWWAVAFLGWHLAATWLPALDHGTGRHWRSLAFPAARFAGLALVLVMGPLLVLRLYQHQQLRQLTSELLEAPREQLTAIAAAEPRLDVTFDAPGLRADDPRAAAYLDLHVDLNACPEGVQLAQRYDPSRPPFDFSGAIRSSVDGEPAGRILLPVFRSFQGFVFERGGPSCITRVERLQSVAGRRLLPYLALVPGWQEQPFHVSLRQPAWFGRGAARD